MRFVGKYKIVAGHIISFALKVGIPFVILKLLLIYSTVALIPATNAIGRQ